MSQEDVAIVRSIYDAFGRGDVRATMGLLRVFLVELQDLVPVFAKRADKLPFGDLLLEPLICYLLNERSQN